MKRTMVAMVLLGLIAVFAPWNARAMAQDSTQGAGQDMKDAGKSVGRATKKTGRKIEKAGKKGTHKSARAVRKGAGKLEDKTQQ